MTFPEILSRSRFYLELKLKGSVDQIDGYFMECSGFQRSQEVVELCEVTPQMWGSQGQSRGHLVRSKIPGQITYTNVTLKRGLTMSSAFWEWMQDVGDGNWARQRREGSMVIYDQASEAQFRFEFTGAWPVKYQISDLDVTAGDYNIEEVEIAVESLTRVDP